MINSNDYVNLKKIIDFILHHILTLKIKNILIFILIKILIYQFIII